jgi:hypothetical protein
MRALSIRQPWAWLIVHSGKDVENRDWSSNYTGPLLIHTGKGMTAAEYDDVALFLERVQHRQLQGIRLPPPGDLERGGIVGRCRMVGCVTRSASPWFFGPYGFALERIEPLPFFECRGQLGFFDVRMPT